jgi:hypothetical protein
MGDESSLLKYFVYELRDPRDLQVFYVGKGSGTREEAHQEGEESRKGKKILEIKNSGHEPIRVIVGRFQEERQAFAVEAVLIKWVYGKENLFNEVNGHGHRLIRPEAERRNKNFSKIEGIDRPARHTTFSMELLQYDTALTELSKRDSQKAEAIERLMDFFISLKTENGQPLIFRASKTRISFFKAQRNCNADLSKNAQESLSAESS